MFFPYILRAIVNFHRQCHLNEDFKEHIWKPNFEFLRAKVYFCNNINFIEYCIIKQKKTIFTGQLYNTHNDESNR